MPAGAQFDDSVPESLQFLFDNFGEAALVTKELCLAEESLTAIPRILRFLAFTGLWVCSPPYRLTRRQARWPCRDTCGVWV